MRIVLSLLFCLSLFPLRSASAQDMAAKHRAAYQMVVAFQTLKNADAFAIGGVGIAAVISEPEKALRQLAARKDAAIVFQELLKEASTEGQLYALLGLKWTADPALFRQKAAAYRTRKTEVKVIQGCIMGRRPIAEIVKSIEEGRYPETKAKDAPTQPPKKASGARLASARNG